MSAAVPEQGFRGPTVCKLVGITYRQLDYWARTNLVTPSVRPADGSGSQRLYGFGDLVELRIIKRLLDAGVSLQRIREAIAHLRAETPDGSLSDLTLMSDDSRIYACHSGEAGGAGPDEACRKARLLEAREQGQGRVQGREEGHRQGAGVRLHGLRRQERAARSHPAAPEVRAAGCHGAADAGRGRRQRADQPDRQAAAGVVGAGQL